MALLMGYLMRRVAFFEVTTAQAINRFAFYVATPALMFNLVSQVPLHQIDWPTVRIYLFSELLIYGGVAVICMRIFRLPAAESVLVGMAAAFVNHLMFVLPIARGLYGLDAAEPIAAPKLCARTVRNTRRCRDRERERELHMRCTGPSDQRCVTGTH